MKKLIRYEISITMYMEDMDEQEAYDYIDNAIDVFTTHEKAGFSTAKVKTIVCDPETGDPIDDLH